MNKNQLLECIKHPDVIKTLAESELCPSDIGLDERCTGGCIECWRVILTVTEDEIDG